MRDITLFSAHVKNTFDNNPDNLVDFNKIIMNASRSVYGEYTKEEANEIIREQFNRIMAIDFKNSTPMARRQAFRAHSAEIYSIIEDVIANKLVSGWGDDPFFEQFVEEKNLALGDKNEFYVEDNSLMQVSKFAGNHHDFFIRVRIA